MTVQDFRVVTILRFEGKITAKDRETAEAETESIVRHSMKEFPAWMQPIDLGITATTRIL